MPIYEYECSDCGHRFERLQRMSAPPPPCPECAANTCSKLVSASAFILKGGGWYKDGYGAKKSAAKDKSAASNGKAPAKSDKSSKSSPAVTSAKAAK